MRQSQIEPWSSALSVKENERWLKVISDSVLDCEVLAIGVADWHQTEIGDDDQWKEWIFRGNGVVVAVVKDLGHQLLFVRLFDPHSEKLIWEMDVFLIMPTPRAHNSPEFCCLETKDDLIGFRFSGGEDAQAFMTAIKDQLKNHATNSVSHDKRRSSLGWRSKRSVNSTRPLSDDCLTMPLYMHVSAQTPTTVPKTNDKPISLPSRHSDSAQKIHSPLKQPEKHTFRYAKKISDSIWRNKGQEVERDSDSPTERYVCVHERQSTPMNSNNLGQLRSRHSEPNLQTYEALSRPPPEIHNEADDYAIPAKSVEFPPTIRQNICYAVIRNGDGPQQEKPLGLDLLPPTLPPKSNKGDKSVLSLTPPPSQRSFDFSPSAVARKSLPSIFNQSFIGELEEKLRGSADTLKATDDHSGDCRGKATIGSLDNPRFEQPTSPVHVQKYSVHPTASPKLPPKPLHLRATPQPPLKQP